MTRLPPCSFARFALAAVLTFPALSGGPGTASGEQLDVGDCGNAATPISAIQGTGGPPALPLDTEVVVEAVVIGDYQGPDGLNGFYLQEEDGEADDNPATSEGIFVYDADSSVNADLGDLVRLLGQVAEYNGQVELNRLTRLTVCGKNKSVTPTVLAFPIESRESLEALEGMLIKFEQPLFVTDNYNLGRYGELTLSPSDRLYQPTQLAEPGKPAKAVNDANDRNRILLDDGSLVQNPELPPYVDADGTRRIGDSIENLTAVLRYGRSNKFAKKETLGFRMHPTRGPESITFKNINPRTRPPAVQGAIKIASFNVLNYFSRLDTGRKICGPESKSECRGAETTAEFRRQNAKVVSALVDMDADVFGLVEIENNGDSTIAALVHHLNMVLGSTIYNYVRTGAIGGDAIRVAFIYKLVTATPVGPAAILDDLVDERFISRKNRPALAQTFELTTSSGIEKLTVVTNHFKSKSSSCTKIGDRDKDDEQGNCAGVRRDAAAALVDWISTDPTDSGDPDFLVMGDLNAYARETALTEFRDNGYIDLVFRDVGDGRSYRYSSYVFQGESGTLDHALATEELAAKVTRAAIWSNSADEPGFLDYNENFKSAPLIGSLSTDGFRSSDHDPVIVGLDFIDDPDGDGVVGEADRCPTSNTSVSVVIGGCNSGVSNEITSEGCSLADHILANANGAKNYDEFVSRVAKFLNELVADSDLKTAERAALHRCVTRSGMPPTSESPKPETNAVRPGSDKG